MKFEVYCDEANPDVLTSANLHALKALLPRYAGQVKCIYIDPPYNTGQDDRGADGLRTGWIYNDRVESPEIREWLGKVVGIEAEDLCRHDKWLCMMYPRLRLLKDFLRDDGVIFASIDDIEVASLRMLFDEIFGVTNRIGVIVWKNATDNNPTQIASEHGYVLCYAKDKRKIASEWKASSLEVKTRLLEVGEKFVKQHLDQAKRQAAYTKWYRENKPQLWPFEDYKFIDSGGVYTGMRSVHNPGKEGYPWDLSPYDAAPTADDLSALGAGLKVSEGGEIDVDDASGRVISRFLPDLQRDLGLVYQPENWDEIRLATWLCRNLPEQSLTHASKQAFVAAWLTDLLRRDDVTLARANLQKFLIRNRLEARIRDLRKQAVGKAFQQTLFGEDAASRVAVSDQYSFDFHPHAYAPSRDYDGRFGHFDFRKHYYGRIGDFDSKEEFECACWLDIQAQQGRIQFWVRNLVRREGSSFFLQKADGRFYPDFLCQLPGKDDKSGPILAVEYKGADRWLSAEDDRLIGGLWANLSEGRCRFVMIKDKRWDGIEEHLA